MLRHFDAGVVFNLFFILIITIVRLNFKLNNIISYSTEYQYLKFQYLGFEKRNPLKTENIAIPFVGLSANLCLDFPENLTDEYN